MPRKVDALANLSTDERAKFKEAAKKSLARPGRFVRLDRTVWQRLEGAMSEAYRVRLTRLIDEEQSIEDDVLRMRIR